MSIDISNTNTLIAILGGLIIIGGSAVTGLRFLFGLNARVDGITDVLKKQTEVQEKMSDNQVKMTDKIGEMKEAFSRFAGATEARLNNIEKDK